MNKRILRQEKLEKDLVAYNPKKWRLNIPFKHYTFRVEDLIPALSGAVGKTALIAAFAVAWSTGLKIEDPTFVAENVRLEIFIASFFALVFSGLLNPYIGPPGNLAPLIPTIPMMIALGVHPLPLGILIGLIGLVLAGLKIFSRVVEINREGTKAGIILLFGFMGITSSLDNLKAWLEKKNESVLYFLLLAAGVLMYVLLNRWKAKWLTIPACALAAVALSAAFGVFPQFRTGIGIPIMNPGIWWNQKWRIGWGLTLENFVSALPFALLTVVTWPIDALAVKAIQESNYPKEASKAVFQMNATYLIVSLRNIVGVILGGSQISAIWRSFMIPLGLVKRPIGASALILGILGIAFGLLGFPVDIAIFPPLLWLVLLFGIYIPLVEVGLSVIKSSTSVLIAVIGVVSGLAVNPVLGWAVSTTIENFGIIKDSDKPLEVSKRDRYLTAALICMALAALFFTYVS